MRERPILFSGAMVRALVDGRKTQTRRVVKGFALELLQPDNFTPEYVALPENGNSPYGYAGDHLWVRESFVAFGRWETRFSEKKGRDEWHFVDMTLETGREYRFGGELPNASRGGATPAWWKRPSIHMPRAASRITLEVTSLRVDRLQDISEADARAEGVESPETEREDRDWSICHRCGGTRLYDAIGPNLGVMPDTDCMECDTHAKRYRHLWDHLNAARGYGWDANPWVWCIEFKRIDA